MFAGIHILETYVMKARSCDRDTCSTEQTIEANEEIKECAAT